MATIKDVAKLSNTSIATVSNVITGKKFVNPDTKEKVLKRMKELNYKPNYAARALKSNRSYSIAAILPDITNPFFGEILKAIQSVINKSDYQLIVVDTDQSSEKELKALNRFISTKQVDGIIMIAPRLEEELFPNEIDIPIIIVDRPSFEKESNFSFVFTDNIRSSSMIAQYAFNSGYKSFACISGPENVPNANLRVKGFVDTLENCGIDKAEIKLIRTEFTFEHGFEAMTRILSTSNLKDRLAVFVTSDIAAWGAMEAVKKMGKKIREQVGIVGYDDIFFSEFLQPSLTTFKTPTEKIGKVVGSMILEQLKDVNLNRPNLIEIEGQLKIRNSI
ncbi:MAG: LacI family DNA-binding transcriptional regulator [Pleomorphochaeta sp.]